ncbi:MAG: tRNA pseudouridine(55) synthase TruB [Chloroflexota bacterium]
MIAYHRSAVYCALAIVVTQPELPLFGFLNVNKPLGITSHDVVAKVRRASGIKKVGHAGTLDPLATGVLILCVGTATRLSEYVMHGTKRYRARVRLGITTSTYDAEGEILQQRDASQIKREAVEQALIPYRGDIQQVPPMFSAIKQGGKKLYELARAGETVGREPRSVRIDSLTIIDWQPPEFTLDITCSAGTYIRSLAYDLGETLGVGAHLAGLVRTASGVFTLENATPLDTLLTDFGSHLVSPAVALAEYPVLMIEAAAEQEIAYGRAIPGALADGTITMAYSADERLIAVLHAESGWLKPQKVFL